MILCSNASVAVDFGMCARGAPRLACQRRFAIGKTQPRRAQAKPLGAGPGLQSIFPTPNHHCCRCCQLVRPRPYCLWYFLKGKASAGAECAVGGRGRGERAGAKVPIGFGMVQPSIAEITVAETTVAWGPTAAVYHSYFRPCCVLPSTAPAHACWKGSNGDVGS